MQKFSLIVFFTFLLFNLCFSQINESCSNAVTIALDSQGVGSATSGLTVFNASQSIPPSTCSGYTASVANDVWFEFTATHFQHYIVACPSSGMDMVLEVRQGPSCNGSFVACTDNGGGNGSCESMYVNTSPGQIYFIRVYDYTGSGNPPTTFSFGLSMSGVGDPPGDDVDIFVQNATAIPSVLAPGDNIELDCEQHYSGTGSDNYNPNVGYFYSENATWDNSDVELGDDSSSIGSSDDYDPEGMTATIPSNATPGLRYILFVADYNNEVDEGSNESSNVVAVPITITGGPANHDLTIGNPEAVPGLLSPGETINLACDQQYNGNGNSTIYTYVGFFLSQDPSWDNSDTYLGQSESQLNLPSDVSDNESISAIIPFTATPGTWYILFVADYLDEIQETNESNNVAAFPISITSGVPSVNVISPNGGEEFEVGSVITINASINGSIQGKTIEYSSDGGNTWHFIWNDPSGDPGLSFNWTIPNDQSTQCLVKVRVAYSGGTISDESNAYFTIYSETGQGFDLNTQGISHLYWPFYNEAIFSPGSFHIPSTWEDQIEGQMQNSDGVTTVWNFSNTHYPQYDAAGNFTRWHHSGHSCYAQDWNFMNGGNSDCQMLFFSPLKGTVIYLKDDCFNTNCNNPTCTSGCGNNFAIQAFDDPTFVFKACHFSELSSNLCVGCPIEAGEYIGKIGNEGSSTAAHVHAVLYKNLNQTDINSLSWGAAMGSNTDPNINPNNPSELCFSKAADFKFDVILDGTGGDVTNIIEPYAPSIRAELFPNPTSGLLNFKVNASASEFFDVRVFSGTGQLIFEDRKGNYYKGEIVQYDLRGMPPGLYILHLRFDQEFISQRFIIAQ
ncbi:MAG: T9SS type A sorting domain-containing protein [Bacteroidota bacterium]